MKALLCLCTAAALALAALARPYMKTKVNRHLASPRDGEYIFGIVDFKPDALDSLFAALKVSGSPVSTNPNIHIFVDNRYHVQNQMVSVQKRNFSSPDEAMKNINNFVRDKTEGRIVDLVRDVQKHTVAIIVHLYNAMKLPNPNSENKTTILSKQLLKMEDKKHGVNLLEIQKGLYLSILLAIPSPGREEEVGNILTPDNIDGLKSSMTNQHVNLEVPTFTLYTGFYLMVNIITKDDGEELMISKYGFRMTAEYI